MVLQSLASVDRTLWDVDPPPPGVHEEIVEIVDQPEDGIIGGFVYQKPDNRKARLTTQINLIMSDALRDMTLAALDSYGAFLLQHAKHDTQIEDAQVPPYQPLFVLEVISAGQGELFYSTASQQFVDDPLRLLDEALGALGSLQTADIFDIALTEGLVPPPLRTVDDGEPKVTALRESLHAALEGSLTALDAYLEALRPHEALLQRDEVAYVKEFAETGHSLEGEEPLTLPEIQKKVAEQRADQEKLQRTVASEVIIGMYQVSLAGFKELLMSKLEACVKLLLELVASRARETCKAIQEGFAAMHEQLQDTPKDIEMLTEMNELLESLPERAAELQISIDEMVAMHEMLEEQQVEVEAAEFSARWESVAWPLKLKLKQEECEAALAADRDAFQNEMVQEQNTFERNVEELAHRVANFHQYTDIARVAKVNAIVNEIQVTLAEYEGKAQTFNKRESLFGSEATEYDALSKIVKDFEPYASLWSTASDWAGWQREWLDGPILQLDPDEVEKAFTNAQRNAAKLVKSFKEVPGCLGIAQQVKDEMAGF